MAWTLSDLEWDALDKARFSTVDAAVFRNATIILMSEFACLRISPAQSQVTRQYRGHAELLHNTKVADVQKMRRAPRDVTSVGWVGCLLTISSGRRVSEAFVMRAATIDDELEMNRTAYAENRTRIRQAGCGHYAAIAAGRLIAITANFEEAVQAIQSLEPPPTHYAVFPAGEEPAFEIIDDLREEVR